MKLKFFIIILITVFIPASIYAQEIEIKSEKVAEKLPSYPYNLKRLIREAERNLKKVNKQIKEKEALEKNREKEKVAREHFEKGNTFHKEGKLEEAKKEWQEIIEISKDPEIKDYIRKAEKIAREEKITKEKKRKEEFFFLRKKVSDLYKEGVSLYRYKRYKEASLKFSEIQKLIPGYAKTEHYLNCISKDINREKISSLYKEAMGFYNNNEFDKAEEIFKIIISLDQTHVRAKKYLHIIPKKRQSGNIINTRRQASMLYKESLRLYKKRRYEESRQKFQELQVLSPGYGKTEHFLSRIDKDINRHKALPLYKEAVGFYNNKELDKAEEIFKQIILLEPSHRKAKKYLHHIIPKKRKALGCIAQSKEIAQQDKPLKQKENILNKKQIRRQASMLYKEALGLYKKRRYEESRQKFQELQVLSPGYGKTEHFLSRIDKEVNREEIFSLYYEGVVLYNNNNLNKAEDIFKQVILLDQNHVKARKYLEYLIPRKKRELERIAEIQKNKESIREDKKSTKEKKKEIKERRIKEKETRKKLDALYKEALSLYKNKEYEVSRQKFQDLQDLNPDYSRTRYYLKRLPKDIEKHRDWLERQKEKQIQEIIQEIERKKEERK